jgi:2-methylcitrate dehydratase PrpD
LAESDGTAVTARVAQFVLATDWPDLPATVQREATRGFVNWVGCALGGSRDPAVEIALATAREFSGPASATVIGRGRFVDPLNAAFLNCLASSAHAYDDTHLATVTHPTGPVAAALLALAERQPVRGVDYLTALTLGIEVECRLSNSILLAPARGNIAWYVTGISGGIGAAAAVARVLGLDQTRTLHAIGLAAAQASGFRQTHATMASSFVPAHAARCGLEAALLAERGFTCSTRILEGPNGFFAVYADPANPAAVTDGLGSHWEALANAYKPYPCGIVIHPAIDAALAIVAAHAPAAEAIESIELSVNPLCLTLCDRPAPADRKQASVSVQHWTAAALVRGAAGIREGSDECVHDATVAALRARVQARPSEKIGRDSAALNLVMKDGRRLEQAVEHCRGSLDRPLSDSELETKFLDQAAGVLPEAAARNLLRSCWDAASCTDMAALASECSP